MKKVTLTAIIILVSLSNAFAALEDIIKKGMTYDEITATAGQPVKCSTEEYWEGILRCEFKQDKDHKYVILRDSKVLHILDHTTFQRQIEIRKMEKERNLIKEKAEAEQKLSPGQSSTKVYTQPSNSFSSPPTVYPSYSGSRTKDIYVKPYVRKNGTHVSGHYRSRPRR